MSTTVIRKACARFPGFVLLAVTPFRGFVYFFAYFSKIRPRTGKSVSALTKTYLADTFLDPEIFPVFSIFQPPQHRPHVEFRRPGSAFRNPGFPFFPESVSEGFSFSGLTAGEKLRHRLACVPAVYLRLFAFSRRSGAHPAARIPMLRTDSGCRGSNRKILCGITGLYYGGINGRFCGSCWTAKRSREKSLIWQEGNQFLRRITRM